MKPHMLFTVLIAVALFAKRGSNMPMLKWAGKDKVVNHHNEVPFRCAGTEVDFQRRVAFAAGSFGVSEFRRKF